MENTWSMVSAIATCGAAIATAFAAVVAIVAMRSWRVQEKHKAFQTYKMSLEVYRIALTMLPKDFSPLNSAQHYSSSDRHRNDAINSFTSVQRLGLGIQFIRFQMRSERSGMNYTVRLIAICIMALAGLRLRNH